MRSTLVASFVGFWICAAGVHAAADTDTELAMNNPDRFAWQIFISANQPAAGSNVLWETWASDTDTFNMQPTFPTAPTPLALHAPIVPEAGRAALLASGHVLPQLPPGIETGVSEESRRNRAAFDFIVQHNLYKVSGLRAAFGTALSFPVDAVELKGNWIPLTMVPAWTSNRVTVADAPKFFHVNATKDGNKFALVALHIITKAVPNWTWATFESEFNPGRCDILGCRDSFGTSGTIAPNPQPGKAYPPCTKTQALTDLIKTAGLNDVFTHYCLKGSQSDFTDNTGLDARLGNSVTERGFVQQSSCMTCHGRSAFNANGQATSDAGFDDNGAPLGPIQPSWYWSFTGSPPIFQGMAGLTRIATPADFVWSIPFCAVDDTANPPNLSCVGK